MELKVLPSFLPSFLIYLLNYLLTPYFDRALTRTNLSKFAGLQYRKCLLSSSPCCTILIYAISYYNTLLGMKGYVMPVGSQCCKVKLNSFSSQGRKALCNQHI